MSKWRTTGGAIVSAGVLLAAMTLPTAAGSGPGNAYRQINLVSDIPGLAASTDPNLINPWGMSFSPTSPLWVSDADANVSTLYAGAVHGSSFDTIPLVVTIPGGAPTGQVYNPTTDFVVSDGPDSGPALFIFASETGKITGWNPSVPASSTAAQVAVTTPNAIYKGLAISTGVGGSWLYAANFHSGHIDVFDGTFTRQHWAGAFHDPTLPAGYAPFNIQNLGGYLFVTYAKQSADRHDEVAGPHKGYVDEYSLTGGFMARVASRGPLDAPWGLAWAPATGFGPFSGDLLVGNFGDGRITAIDPTTWHVDGQLKRPDGRKVKIPGLWGLMFGNGVAGSPHALLFTAGIRDEAHGLLGEIKAAH